MCNVIYMSCVTEMTLPSGAYPAKNYVSLLYTSHVSLLYMSYVPRLHMSNGGITPTVGMYTPTLR